MGKIRSKQVRIVLFFIILLSCVCLTSVSTTTEVHADKIDLKGNYLYDRDGVKHKIPISKKGNHTKAAEKVANLIVKCVDNRPGDTDLYRVDMAAYYVSLFANRDNYTMQGPYYNKAYGVFIAKEYSCAGTADAMKMVLTKMGFKAKHVNKNKYKHQWCTLTMDGQKGYADGQAGYAAYGQYFTKKNQIILVPMDTIFSKKSNGEI